MKIIKLIVKFFFNFCLLFYYIFILLINIKKISKSNKIFIQDKGGFGHSFIFQDLIRRNNKESLYIQYYQDYRHNEYLPYLFNLQNILIKVGFEFKIFNKKFYLGYIENESFDILKLLLKFLFLIFNKKNKFFFIDEFYNLILNEKGGYKLVHSYCEYINKKNISLNLNHFYKKKYDSFFINTKRKKICIYLRNRISNYHETTIRNGGNFNNYKKTIEFLIKKNFYILLVGEADQIFERKYLFDNRNFLITHKSIELPKRFFEIASFIQSDFYIFEHGGPQFFALYNRNSIILNGFPYGQTLGNVKIVYKKLLNKKENKYLKKIPKELKFNYNFNWDKYELQNLSSEEIFNLISNLVN